VACVDHYAAQVGAEVLAAGGNAVDAAIAVAFALAVTYPAAGNLGGGGFMVVAMADGRRAVLDYREMAPQAAHPEMFLDELGNIDRAKAGIGHWVVGVPGTVAGLELAHRGFAVLPWARLVRPAQELARAGIVVDADLARGLTKYADDFRRYPGTAASFLHPDGTAYAQGEVLRQPDLASTLQAVGDGGSAAFYRGPIAAAVVAEMRRAGGLLTLDDFAAYRAIERRPLTFSYAGDTILCVPPPSSGGVVLCQILGQLEAMNPRQYGIDSPQYRHLFAEASRRAFAQRAQFLGDPEATYIDLAQRTSPLQIARLAASIELERASSSDRFGPPRTDTESEETTHFSVVDAWGNAVANTYTIEESFGSKVVAPGTGFLLNNELHDFNLKPGWTDRKGRIGTAPNLPRPRRRPLSSMSPCIVIREGRPFLVTGSPGGRTILSTVASILLAVLEFDLPVADAVHWARQHHQWFPDELRIEESVVEATRGHLEGLGHEVVEKPLMGDAHTIQVSADGSIQAVADLRRDGWVASP
jgi:gamma-glutamyltranspeptidase/glutathione hydrolase